MALLKGMGALAGTFAVVGGATLAVSTVAMSGVRVVVKYRRREREVPCTLCSANKRYECSVCRGACVLAWSPIRAPQVRRWAACPLCAATGLQACPNCLGDGVFVPQ